ncbi:MAG: histidine kinase [Geobacteraceae bacterium]|nr:histidine kinase [Geobacteraceae bacterium]
MVLKRFKNKLNRSLRFRLISLISALIGLLTFIFATYFIYHERSLITRQLRSEGELLASLIASEIQTSLYAGASEDTAWHAARLFQSSSATTIRITDQLDGEIVYSTKIGMETPSNYITVKKDIHADSHGRSPESILLDEPAPVVMIGRVELVMDSEKINTMMKKLIFIGGITCVIFWFVASKLSLFFMKRITSSFQTLMTAVKRIEDGNLEPWFPETVDDEPGRALAAINSLAQSLKLKNEENERLQAEIVKGLRLEIDEEKSRNMAKLIQTNRMTSLGLLVSSMAHEINNPNGAIRLAAELLERGWRDMRPVLNEVAEHEGEFRLCGMPYSAAMTDIEKAVDAISRSSLRIEQVVRNLRGYSLGSREKEQIPFDLNSVAENSVAILRAHGKMESIEIISTLATDLPLAGGNPFQTEQVVINLLMNAIQAMTTNHGRIVTISTEKDPLTGEPLLHVTDNGPGVPEEHIAHLFEPFFSTRIDQGGSGLGLYISEFIIKEQGGSLTIVNMKEGGCRATIRLAAA